MKVLNRVFQILAIVFGLASLVCFFMTMAKITVGGETYELAGSVLAFGGKKEIADGVVADMAKSTHLLFCLLVTAFGFVMSVFSFKKKGLRYATPAFALTSAIYMLVLQIMEVSATVKIDARAILLKGDKEVGRWVNINGWYNGDEYVTKIDLTNFFLYAVIALFLFAICSIAYLLIDDAIEVAASKGAKKSILKRVGLFFRDYKSEIKKIVWPGLKDVVKNTVIVLIMCLLVGALIWILDAGLLKLLELILSSKTA